MDNILINIKPVNLVNDVIYLTVSKQWSILELKNYIRLNIKNIDISHYDIILIYEGDHLFNENNTLVSYNIKNQSQLNLIFRLKPEYEMERLINNRSNTEEEEEEEEEAIFTIYTTGITNWMDRSDTSQNIINLWIRNNFLDNIIKYINPRYTIIVQHYDPLVDARGERPQNKNIEEYKEKIIVTKLLPSDRSKPRVINSEFIENYLPIQSISDPHVIIDFAHIFHFISKPGIVKERDNGHGVGPDLSLNVIPFAPGSEKNIQCFTEETLLIVSSNGHVFTFIDKMIYLGMHNPEPNIFTNDEPTDDLYKYVPTPKKNRDILRHEIEDKLVRQGKILGSREMIEEVNQNPLIINYDREQEIKNKKIFKCLWSIKNENQISKYFKNN